MADISLVNLTKFYDKHQTIHTVSLEIKTGEFIVFVGPSGCGKSTLLRMIAGLEEISGGELYIDKEKMTTVDPASRGVAMVFQSYALYPHMSVEENMGFGLKMNGVSKEFINKRVMVAANTLQMEHLLKRKPKDLSGGQRQRVAIGRAIVRDPKVFLFDEPLSNLDAELRVEMRLQIAKLHNQLKNTMIYVTHDQVEAMTLADRIVVLREGKIEQVGTPLELYHSPVNEFVAGFIGSPKMNFIPCDLVNVKDESIIIRLPDGQEITLSKLSNTSIKPGEKLTLGIRPEHILIDSQENFHNSTDVKLVFRSEVAERLGSSTYLFGDYPQVKGFKAHINGDKSIGMFENVRIGFSLDDCHLFDTSGNSILTHKVKSRKL